MSGRPIQIGIILHQARLRRIKLGFVCLLTAVGIPMILAGEEYGDQHDLFDARGNVTHQGGKQVDPVNYSRVDEADRRRLFDYVARLVKLRTSHRHSRSTTPISFMLILPKANESWSGSAAPPIPSWS